MLSGLASARWATAGLFLIQGAVVGSWAPYIPDRAHALGLSTGQLGGALLVAGAGAVLGMPLAAQSIGRLGSQVVSGLSGTIFPLAMAAAVLAVNVQYLLCALLLFGLAGASMDIAMNAHGVLVEQRMKRRVLSSFHGIYSLGGVLGAAATSAALARGVSPGRLAGRTAILLVVLVWSTQAFMLPKTLEPGLVEPRERRAWLNGRLVLLGTLVFASMISEGAVADWSALLLRVTHHLGAGAVGVGFVGFSVAMLLARFTGDAFVSHVGEAWALRIGGLLGIAGGLMMGFGRCASVAVGGCSLIGLGMANASPILYRAAGRVAGVPARVGIATAVGIGYAGLMIGPPLLGFAGQIWGVPSIFSFVAGLAFLLTINASSIEG